MDDWLTTKEAAQLAGVTEQRIRELAGAGRFPGANTKARSWLIPRAAFERYLEADRDRRRKDSEHVD